MSEFHDNYLFANEYDDLFSKFIFQFYWYINEFLTQTNEDASSSFSNNGAIQISD